MSGAPGPEAKTGEAPQDDSRAFCRQVLESLSDVIEGDAPEELCREIDRVLGDCRPYQAFRATLEETIRLTRELGAEPEAPGLDDESFRRCVEAVRQRLEA